MSAIHSIGTEDWNHALCLIQGRSNFVFEILIKFRSARHDLSFLGVATGRHSRICKELLLHIEIQGFTVSSLFQCDVGGSTRAPCILIYNIKEEDSVRKEVFGEVIRKLDVVVRVED